MLYVQLAARVLAPDFAGLAPDEALPLLEADGADLWDLIALANRLREQHRGRRIRLCSIVNARSGRCGEDCAFCAQSGWWQTPVESHPLRPAVEIVARAAHARTLGAREFSIVTSGRGRFTAAELDTLCEAVAGVAALGVEPCASLGAVEPAAIERLRAAGLARLHHNLETARSFFPAICTTHDYDDRLRTVRAARAAGLRVCCGGIFGLGETPAQRLELALELRALDVDSIPLNFLDPRPGTPLADQPRLTPRECLRIVATFRLLHPRRDIFVCGGREASFRQLQAAMFAAGANGTMAGDYLTTAGRPATDDLELVADLGLEVES